MADIAGYDGNSRCAESERKLPCGLAAEEISDGLAVLLGCLDAGYVAAAREHDELESGDGGGNRLGLGGTAE